MLNSERGSASARRARTFDLDPPLAPAAWVTVSIWIAVSFPLALFWVLVGRFQTPIDYVTFFGFAAITTAWSFLLLLGFRFAQGRPNAVGWAIVCGFVVLTAALQYGSEWAFAEIMYTLFPDEVEPTRHSLRAIISNSLDFLITNGMLAALLAMMGAVRKVRAEAAKALAAQAQASEAELRALRLQLNPHFLLNSLAGLEALLSAGRITDAEATLARLSGVLRGALQPEPTGKVPLEDELDAVGAFIDVEAIRLGDRLRVEFDCPPELADALVPEMILQPLVENTIKHAMGDDGRQVMLTLSARAENGQLWLRVANTGVGAKRAGSGLGIGQRNTFKRLEALYGQAATLRAGHSADGYAVDIRLPLELQSTAEQAAEARFIRRSQSRTSRPEGEI